MQVKEQAFVAQYFLGAPYQLQNKSMKIWIRKYKSGGWEFHFRGEIRGVKVERRWKSPIHTKGGTEKWGEKRLEKWIREGVPVEVVPPDKSPLGTARVPTVREYGADYLKAAAVQRLKPSALASRAQILRDHIVPTIGGVRLDAIRPQHVDLIREKLVKHSSKTLANVLAVLRAMLRYAAERELITHVPTIRGPRVVQPEMDFYTFEELDALVEAARQVGESETMVLLLGARAGLRSGEMRALEWRDVGPDRLTIRRAEWRGTVGTPKGGRLRYVPLTPSLATALANGGRGLVLQRNDQRTTSYK